MGPESPNGEERPLLQGRLFFRPAEAVNQRLVGQIGERIIKRKCQVTDDCSGGNHCREWLRMSYIKQEKIYGSRAARVRHAQRKVPHGT